VTRVWFSGLGASVLAAGVAMLMLRRSFVVVAVSGDSMLPTLRPGDRVLVRRVPLHRVDRGQLVVVAPPADLPRQPGDPPWLVKRAVALPGDPVPGEIEMLRGLGDGRVPPGKLLILGDNTGRSYDSRRAGYFRAESLLGVVIRTLR
jgi:signal peptidase I